ncbi:MAG: HAD family hydrolase [Elusimicrobia bacterium]|nr:HAD family hydrolase [Elusimicrobiota bacterium]
MSENPVVFLFDVDNTLLDNDRVTADLRRYLGDTFGAEIQTRYWSIFEALRAELGYADYLGALQRFRVERPRDPHVLDVSGFLLDYPFGEQVFPGALESVAACARLGTVAILSDGDAVFQPRKIMRSGLREAVGGRVLVYTHKERMLGDVEARLPAARYVMVDDKRRILAALKTAWGARVTTIFPAQGHYASDPAQAAAAPEPDVRIAAIAELAALAPSLVRA